jgi:hypothetical protein
MTSTQMLITLDKEENKIVEEEAKKMNISKMNAIKEIIREYRRLKI